MKVKKRDSIFGRYPANDYLNDAIRFLIRDGEGDRELAIGEIVGAITAAGGYLCDDVLQMLHENAEKEANRKQKEE